MKDEELRFEAYDMMKRVRAIKVLAKAIADYDDKKRNPAAVEHYAKGIIYTANGEPGWGYSQENSRKEWELLKKEVTVSNHGSDVL